MVSKQKKHDLKQVAIFVVVVIAINFLSGIVFTRFDFTKEKRYTLSPISRHLMDSLPQVVTVTVYLQGNDLPAAFKRLQSSTRDMLQDLQAYSHSRLKFDFVDPIAGLNRATTNPAHPGSAIARHRAYQSEC